MGRKSRDEYIADEFDRAAGSYDKSRLVKSFQHRTQALVIDRMRLEKGMNVLDLGCGTGWGSIDIAAKLEGTGKVIGLDLSGKMVDRAKQNLSMFSYDNVEFSIGSATSLDYHDYFHYVISTNAFHHFENKELIFSRVWSSLRHDGIFMVQDICDDYLLMRIVDLAGKVGEKAHVGSATSSQLTHLLLKAGFVDIEVERMKLNWFWGIMIGKGTKQSEHR